MAEKIACLYSGKKLSIIKIFKYQQNGLGCPAGHNSGLQKRKV